MSEQLSDLVARWDFDHGRVRDMPKVYIDGRWHYQCRCGFTSTRHADHDAHRYSVLADLILDRDAEVQARGLRSAAAQMLAMTPGGSRAAAWRAAGWAYWLNLRADHLLVTSEADQ